MSHTNITGASWLSIVSACKTLRRKNYDREYELALLYKQIHDTSAWKDSSRYTSRAAFEAMSKLSWEQICVGELDVKPSEVARSLRLLKIFKASEWRTYGRASLSRIASRASRNKVQVKDIMRACQDDSRAIGHTTGQARIARILDVLAPAHVNKNPFVEKMRREAKQLRLQNALLQDKLRTASDTLAAYLSVIKGCRRCSRQARLHVAA